MRRFIALAAVLVLSACGKSSDAPETPQPPADAPTLPPPVAVSDFPGDFNAIGTEPFWAVEVRKDKLTLKRPEQPDLVVPNPGPVVNAGQGEWRTSSLTLILAGSVCNDGMSDRIYPYSATVQAGGMVMRGCAARPAAFASEPKP